MVEVNNSTEILVYYTHFYISYFENASSKKKLDEVVNAYKP
jgi:hypothetical protein